MVDGAGAGNPGLRRRLVVDVEPRAAAAAGDVTGLEAEPFAEELVAPLRTRRVCAHAREPADRVLRRDLGMPRDERRLAGVVDDELETHPLRVGEDERALAAPA